MARGEIGFLIMGLVQQIGLVGSTLITSSGVEAYEVAIWALILKMLAGHNLAGVLVKADGRAVARAILYSRWD